MTPRLTPKQISHNTSLLIDAAQQGRIQEVINLIPVSDPKATDSEALLSAVLNGYIDIVKLLLPVSDPKANYSSILRWAVYYGREEMVKLLIPVSDAKAKNSYALWVATEYNKTECIKLLLPVSDYHLVAQKFSERGYDITVLEQCIEEYEALLQKDRLNNTLSETAETKNNFNKRKM